MAFATIKRVAIIAAITATLAPTSSTALAAAPSPLIYHRGPVISPIIVPIYWGTFSSINDPVLQTEQTFLVNFADELTGAGLPADLEPTARQYGVWGASVHSPILDSDPLPSVLNSSAVEGEINKMVQAARVPYWGSPFVFVLLTKGISLGSDYGHPTCAWHNHDGTGSGARYFAHVPYPGFGTCNPSSSETLPGLWQVMTSHEILETATDPELTGWIASTRDEGADPTTCNTSYNAKWYGFVTSFVDNKSAYTNNGTVVCSPVAKEQYTPIAAVSRGFGLLDIVFQGTDHALWHKRFNGTAWETAHSLGGYLMGTPSIVALGQNELHVITTQARTAGVSYTDRNLYDMVWTASGGWASTFTAMTPSGVPSLLGNPSAVANNGRIDVAAPSSWTSFYELYYSNGVWNGLFSGGSGYLGYSAAAPPTGVAYFPNTAPPVVLWSNQAGGTNASTPDFATPPTYPYSGDESSSVAGGASFAPMGATNRGSEVVDVAAVGTDNNLYFSNSPSYAAWTAWIGLGLGTVVGAPSVVSWDHQHRTDVFAVGTDSALRHAYSSQDASNWSTGALDNGPDFGTPVAVSWSANRLDVFIKGWDRHLWHFWSNDGVNWGSEGFADTLIN